jgi:hypothetical protein
LEKRFPPLLRNEAKRLKENKMNVKKLVFIVMLGIFTLPTVASAKPSHRRHTQARKMHLAKFRIKR